jgi:hypothetical protein
VSALAVIVEHQQKGQMMAARTEIETAADTLAQLYHAGLIPPGKRVMACRAAGVTPSQLTDAQVRLSNRSNQMLRPHGERPLYPSRAQAPAVDHKPMANPTLGASEKTLRKLTADGKNPDTGKPYPLDPSQMSDADIAAQRANWLANSERWDIERQLLRCSGMSVNPVHWAQLEAFRDHATYPWRKFSGCRECMRTYQQARHLKVQQMEQLDRAGITISMAEGAAEFVCAGCDRKIEEHERGYVEGRIYHEGCHPEAVPLSDVAADSDEDS